MITKPWHWNLRVAGLASLLAPTAATGALLAGAVSAAQGAPLAPAARTAQALRATDNAHLHYISASGSVLFEEGRATGTLPGRMRVRFNVGATFSGSFTIYAAGGSITGHGSAIPHGAGTYESFAGSITVTGGHGRYARAHGQAKLYGTFNRNNYALVVQTVGTLHY